MGRAVGGASAAGCGAFSAAGLIIGVGLTVWLGSMALSGMGGGGGSKKDDRTASLASQAAALTSTSAPAGAGALTITPQANLDDGTTVAVTGAGLAPGPVRLTTCLTFAPAAGSPRCDPATAAPAEAATEGTLAASYPVTRVIRVGGGAYDCAAAAGACSLVALRTDDPTGTGPSVALAFAPGLPSVDASIPPVG